MPRTVWNDVVSWQTRQISNSSKYQIHALMTIISKRKYWNPWEKCQMYAWKWFWNAYTWHVLEDLISYGQWTNLHDRSQNGPRLVHVKTNSIVMWRTVPNNADWDCFEAPILQEIWRIQNLQQVNQTAVFSQFNRIRKHFLRTQDWGWTVCPHLIYGIWLCQFFTETRIRAIKSRETRARTSRRFVQHLTSFKRERHLMEWLMI